MAWLPEPRLDPGSQPRCPPRDERRFARAHDPEYIAMDSVRGAIRLALRCLAGNCLSSRQTLDLMLTQAVRATFELPALLRAGDKH